MTVKEFPGNLDNLQKSEEDDIKKSLQDGEII